MRILGLDIGTSSIKAVELDSAFGRYEIHEYHEQQLLPGEDTKSAVAKLMVSLSKKPDRIAMALRTGQVTFRNLQLPTRDKKAIYSAVGFELEDELPFPLSQAVYNYTTLTQIKQGVYLHVVATLARTIESEIAKLGGMDLDADVLTTEAWAYRTFLNKALHIESRENPTLLIQMGESRTVLYAHYNSAPLLCREIAWGGRDLTLAIAQHYKIPLEEAEKGKLDHGFVVSPTLQQDVTREQNEFSLVMSEPLLPFLAEIKQALLSCKNLAHSAVSEILVSGGTSVLPGLVRVIQENTGVATRKIQALSSLTPSGITYSEEADSKFLLAASLALSIAGSDRASTINFRTGKYSKHGRSTAQVNMDLLRKPILAAVAITACLLASVITQSYVYKSRLKEADSQLEKSVKGFFGQISAGAVRTYLSNPANLRTQVNKELTKQRELAKLTTPNPHSSLEFLRELSATVSREVVVDMIRYQVGSSETASFLKPEDATASFAFLVASLPAVDKLTSMLSTKVTGLEKTKVEEVASVDGGPKKFRVTYTGKLSEDSYGK